MNPGVPSSATTAREAFGQHVRVENLEGQSTRTFVAYLTSAPFVIPALFALALTLAYAIPFSAILWPFGDVYEVLLKADSLTWGETLVKAFREGVEYRPFFMLVVKVLYETVGLHLWIYKFFVLVQFALVFGVFIAILRP